MGHVQMSRRVMLAALLAAPAALPQSATAAARIGDDGLYTEDWYVESFLDLAEDLAAATQKNRHFALQWSQRGCPLCKRLHTVYFADPAIEAPIKAQFDIVHLDLFGAREVIAFDGTRLTEKAFGAREGIRATPTFQFFAIENGATREVARMPGLLGPEEFSAMFRYVAAGGYAEGSFADWLARQKPQKS